MFSLFKLFTTVFVRIAVNNPAIKPIVKLAPMLSIYPAPTPVIIAPVTQPIAAYIAPIFPPFTIIDAPYVPITLPIMENHMFAGAALYLKICPVPCKATISVVMMAKAQKRKAAPKK